MSVHLDTKQGASQNAFDLAIQTKQPEISAIIIRQLFGIKEKPASSLDRLRIVNDLVSIQKAISEWTAKLAQNNKMTAVALAAAHGDLAMLETFDPNVFKQADLKGLTPLHYAIFHRKKNAVEFLAQRSDPSFVTPDGNTYLHFAAMTGQHELVRCIQQLKIDANKANKKGCTPAHFLATACDMPVELVPLNKMGASLTIQNNEGITPLALLYAKAFQKTPALVTYHEIFLSFSNLLNLGAHFYIRSEMAGKLSFEQLRNPVFLSIAGITALISSFFKQKTVSALPATQQSNAMVRGCVSPFGSTLIPLILPKTLEPGVECFTTYAIVKNSAYGLKRCAQQFWDRPVSALSAAGVHLGNMILEFGSLAESYLSATDPHRSDRFFNPYESKISEHCPVPDGLTGGMIEIAASQDLHPDRCLNHAKIILAGNSPFDERQFKTFGCKYINSLFRQMALVLHPDKTAGINQKKAEFVFSQLEKSKNTLCPKRTVAPFRLAASL